MNRRSVLHSGNNANYQTNRGEAKSGRHIYIRHSLDKDKNRSLNPCRETEDRSNILED